MLGMACADALGAQVEFMPPGTFSPVSDMVGGGPHGLPPGAWTDDTSLAICLAESLIERQTNDPVDQLRRYVRWWQEGHNSSTSQCFDIGIQTSLTLGDFERTGEPFPGDRYPDKAGNGSLMRLAPVVLAYAGDAAAAIDAAATSSRTTHGARQAVDACRWFAGALLRELGVDAPAPADLHPAIADVVGGSYRHNDPPAIHAGGYVVPTLEAALWAIDRATSFEEAVLAAVNLGDDSDTVGAVTGQLAGARYGVEAIPPRWLDVLVERERLERLADDLLALPTSARRPT